MPYSIRKVKSLKPYRIINNQTGKVVGSSVSLAKAKRSISYRLAGEPSKNIKQFKRKVDNKMRSYGETDLEKKTIRINKSKHKGEKGELLNTIVHEKKHILHPQMHEKTVRKETKKTVKALNRKQKQKHYGLFRKKR